MGQYHVVVARDTRRGGKRKVLQTTFCTTLGAARAIQEESQALGEFWWADHEIVRVPAPLTRSETAYLVAA